MKCATIAKRVISAGLLSLLVVTSLSAQVQKKEGFHFTSPLSLSAGRDNRFLAGESVQDDTVFLFLLPTTSIVKASQRTEFSFSYQPEFELFQDNSQLNAWNHTAGFRLSSKITPRLRLDVGDSFLTTRDPSRRLGNSSLVLPRSLFQENAFYTGVDYELSAKTTLGFRYDTTVTLFNSPDATRTGFFDQMGHAGTVTLARRLTSQQKLSGTYSYLTLRLLNRDNDPSLPATPGVAEPTHYLTLGYDVTLNRNLVLRLAGGTIRANGFSYMASGEIEKRLGPIWIDLGYHRTISFFGGLGSRGLGISPDLRISDGLLVGNIYQMATFGVRGNLTSRLGLDMHVRGSKTSSGRPGSAIKSLIGSARVDYKLTDRVVLFSTAEVYAQRSNEQIGIPLSRGRFFGGLEIILSRSNGSRESRRSPVSTTTPGNDF
jgi:hypothetical protein